MLSFILGGPKSGKTEEMIRRIQKDISVGNKVLLIVPEQNTVSTERRITDTLDSSPGLLMLEVANFRRLSNIVFRALGGLCYNYLNKGGQAIIMWRVLSALYGSLSTFKLSENTDVGLISSLITLFNEFSDYGISPDVLEKAKGKLPSNLQPRIEDIAAVYELYDELSRDGFDNEKDDLSKVAHLIEKSGYFGDTSIYIDAFSGFTPAEFKVIEALIGVAPRVCISLCLDPLRDGEIFKNVLGTKERLSSLANKYGVATEYDLRAADQLPPEKKFFAENCFTADFEPPFEGEPDNIEICCASDIYSECELVASDIMRQIRNGSRFRDLCIVMGDPKEYKGILDVILARHGIPCHFSAKRDVSQSLCVKAVLSALNIITYNWRLSDVISYLKTGLCSITDEEADLIEEYASTWSISGSLWKTDDDWNMNPNGYAEFNEKDRCELIRINEIRDRLREPILDLAETMKGKTTAESAAVAIYEFIVGCVVPENLVGDDLASWNALCDSLEQLSLCGKDTEVSDTETLKRLIKLVAAQSSYSLIPTSVDEVSCVSATSLKDGLIKKCYIIGVNDGSFPVEFSEGNLINDSLRSSLVDRAGLELPHDPEEMYTEQLWLFYRAFLMSDNVWVSRYASSLDGGEKLPSSAMLELNKLYPDLKIKTEKDFPLYSLVYDKPSAFDRISTYPWMKEVFADDKLYKNAVEALDVPLSTYKCGLVDDDNLRLFEKDLKLTQSRIDSFVHCRFAYALQYELKLREQLKVTYDPRDVGNFIHKLLEEFFKKLKSEGKSPGELSDYEQKSLVDNLIDNYILDTCGNHSMVSKRLFALFERLRRHGLVFVRSICREFADSDFRPSAFELSINNHDSDAISPYSIALSDGTRVYLTGQIDRVDTYEKNGKTYFRIVDYKTGSKAFKLDDLEKGLNLQMFLYLFSVMENQDRFKELVGCEGELVPSGVLYYLARLKADTYDQLTDYEGIENDLIGHIERQGMLLCDDDIISAMTRSDNDIVLPAGALKGKAGSLFTLESLGEIENKIRKTVSDIAKCIKSGNADAEPMKDSSSPCEYCKMKVVCRRSTVEGGEFDE